MIYLDNGATTQMAPEVLEAMLPYMTECYGNASSIHSLGTKSKKLVNSTRRKIAAYLDAQPDEIFFTSGGSESDNWAIKAVAHGRRKKGNHIITTRIEHPAVLNTCKALEQEGFRVTYLKVDGEGFVDPEDLKAAMEEETILVSIMYANNEIGTIEPIEQLAAIAHEKGALFHTDAVQAFGKLPISVSREKIDLLSASAHKMRGPKGIGLLYISSKLDLQPLIHGGGQERGLRSGTENVPAIAGFGKAVELAQQFAQEQAGQERKLRDYLIQKIRMEIPDCRLNGPEDHRLPGNVNFVFDKVEGESVVLMLDMKGICASSGSACSSTGADPSHVMRAIGITENQANGSLRLTLSHENTMEQMDETVKVLKEILQKLRSMRV